jgi:NDP-sugar pyrophosphorylase family protein
MTNRHCVLLAGGLGTRLAEITGDLIPKALVRVGGIPFLHFKLRSLIQMGFTSVDILVGQHGDQIEKFIADGNYPEIVIRCFRDGPTLLGTAGAIASVLHKLPLAFWVTYADSYVVADIEQANRIFDADEDCVMAVLRNQDKVEKSNVSIDESTDHVIEYTKDPLLGTHEWIDFGILRLTKRSFLSITNKAPVDLREVINIQATERRMRAFKVKELFWDIGTPARLLETTREFQSRGWI